MDRNPWIFGMSTGMHPCLNTASWTSPYARYDGRNARMYLGGRDIHFGGGRGGGCRGPVPKVGTNKSWGSMVVVNFPIFFWRSLESEIFPKVFCEMWREIWKKESTHTFFFGGMFVWIHVTSCGMIFTTKPKCSTTTVGCDEKVVYDILYWEHGYNSCHV